MPNPLQHTKTQTAWSTKSENNLAQEKQAAWFFWAPVTRQDIQTLWVNMTAAFGHRFIKTYGLEDTGVWYEALCDLSQSALKKGFHKMLHDTQQVKAGQDVWPPNVKEFRAYCVNRRCDFGLPETRVAFSQVLDARYLGTMYVDHSAVYYAAVWIGYEKLTSMEAHDFYADFSNVYEVLSNAVMQGLCLTEYRAGIWDESTQAFALADLSDKSIQQAILRLANHVTVPAGIVPKIIDIPDGKEGSGTLACLSQMAHAYVARTPQQREGCLFVTPLNANRHMLNDLIREGLKREGHLAASGYQTVILEAKHLSATQLTWASSYEKGDLLRFNQRIEGLPVQKDSFAKVIAIDTTRNTLELQAQQGNTFAWYLPRYSNQKLPMEIYREATRELCVGDQITWRRSDKARDRVGGSIASVIAIDNAQASLAFRNGKRGTLNFDDFTHRHWDYAYASTTHAVQGKTCQSLFAFVNAYAKTSTASEFYTLVTRARLDVTLWTNNKAMLLDKITQVTGDKTSALETSGWFEQSTPVLQGVSAFKAPAIEANSVPSDRESQLAPKLSFRERLHSHLQLHKETREVSLTNLVETLPEKTKSHDRERE